MVSLMIFSGDGWLHVAAFPAMWQCEIAKEAFTRLPNLYCFWAV